MEVSKLKMRIGEHEFEAEGSSQDVQAQFAAWRELIEMLVKQPPPAPPAHEIPTPAPTPTQDRSELMLSKIMRHEGRIVSLTARGASLEDEILLVLLGQRNLRSNDSVSGGEILDGLRLTGRSVNRIDYQLDKMTDSGDVITVGANRARRYRLTNQGFAKAQEKAMDLVALVA